jgi:hypothetical protein
MKQLNEMPIANQDQASTIHEQLAKGISNEIDLMLANGQFDSFHKFINLLIPVLEKAQKRIRMEAEHQEECQLQ